jgi:hypothetical protein
MTTFMPCLARDSAVARPMPSEPPVTSAHSPAQLRTRTGPRLKDARSQSTRAALAATASAAAPPSTAKAFCALSLSIASCVPVRC